MSYFNCPYCNESLPEPDDCNEQDKEYEEKCSKCLKNFVFNVSYSKDYSEHKANCLNGAEHDYKEINGYPKEYFENKRRCSMCSKEIVIKEVKNNE